MVTTIELLNKNPAKASEMQEDCGRGRPDATEVCHETAACSWVEGEPESQIRAALKTGDDSNHGTELNN